MQMDGENMLNQNLLMILEQIAANTSPSWLQYWGLFFAALGALGTTFFTALLWAVTKDMAKATEDSTIATQATLAFNKKVYEVLEEKEAQANNTIRYVIVMELKSYLIQLERYLSTDYKVEYINSIRDSLSNSLINKDMISRVFNNTEAKEYLDIYKEIVSFKHHLSTDVSTGYRLESAIYGELQVRKLTARIEEMIKIINHEEITM